MDKVEELRMTWEVNRLATFNSWPFDASHSKCSVEKMAEAGFFSIPSDCEPDLVKCFVCLKELDNWEEEDDPWTEHKRHSPKCPFIINGKKEGKYTIEEWLKLEAKRQQLRGAHAANEVKQSFISQAMTTRNELESVLQKHM